MPRDVKTVHYRLPVSLSCGRKSGFTVGYSDGTALTKPMLVSFSASGKNSQSLGSPCLTDVEPTILIIKLVQVCLCQFTHVLKAWRGGRGLGLESTNQKKIQAGFTIYFCSAANHTSTFDTWSLYSLLSFLFFFF